MSTVQLKFLILIFAGWVNHQGLDNELIEKLAVRPVIEGPVDCRERLDGILKYDHRTAA